LKEIAANDQITIQATIACLNTWEYFTLAKLDEENGQLVNLKVGVQYILTTM